MGTLNYPRSPRAERKCCTASELHEVQTHASERAHRRQQLAVGRWSAPRPKRGSNLLEPTYLRLQRSPNGIESIVSAAVCVCAHACMRALRLHDGEAQ
jgi:hypothetical protein